MANARKNKQFVNAPEVQMTGRADILRRLERVGKFDALCAEAAAAITELVGELRKSQDDYITHTLACVVADGSEMAKAIDWLASKVERVEAERDRLAGEVAGYEEALEHWRGVEAERDRLVGDKAMLQTSLNATAHNVVALRTEIAALKPVAERYEWLRKSAHRTHDYDRTGNDAHWFIGFYADAALLGFDAAIDAALSANAP